MRPATGGLGNVSGGSLRPFTLVGPARPGDPRIDAAMAAAIRARVPVMRVDDATPDEARARADTADAPWTVVEKSAPKAPAPKPQARPLDVGAFREGQRVRVRPGLAGIDGVPVSLAGELVTVASVGPKRVTVRPDGRGKTYALAPRALEVLDPPAAPAPPSDVPGRPDAPAYHLVSFPCPDYDGDWDRFTSVADELGLCALPATDRLGLGPPEGFILWHTEGNHSLVAVTVVDAATLPRLRAMADAAKVQLAVQLDVRALNDADGPRGGDSVLRVGAVVRDEGRRWRVDRLHGASVRLKAVEGTGVTTVDADQVAAASDASGEFRLMERRDSTAAPAKAPARKGARA